MSASKHTARGKSTHCVPPTRQRWRGGWRWVGTGFVHGCVLFCMRCKKDGEVLANRAVEGEVEGYARQPGSRVDLSDQTDLADCKMPARTPALPGGTAAVSPKPPCY